MTDAIIVNTFGPKLGDCYSNVLFSFRGRRIANNNNNNNVPLWTHIVSHYCLLLYDTLIRVPGEVQGVQSHPLNVKKNKVFTINQRLCRVLDFYLYITFFSFVYARYSIKVVLWMIIYFHTWCQLHSLFIKHRDRGIYWKLIILLIIGYALEI